MKVPGRVSAGAALWVAMAGGAAAGFVPVSAIEALALLAPLVVVPLGLEIVERWDPRGSSAFPGRAARFLQPFAGALLCASFLLPAGRVAGALAGLWLLVAVLVGLWGLQILSRGAPRHMDDLCMIAALGYLPVGGVWVLLSRSGAQPMGFLEPIILLTGVHFHFAAFAAPILAAATGRALRQHIRPGRSLFPFVAAGVVAGPAVLAAGWATATPFLKVVAAVLLAVSYMGLAFLTLFVLPTRSPLPRVLLAASALSQTVAIVLAAIYALGEYRELTTLSIPQMAMTHGILNGVGFTLLGLLGWTLNGGAAASQRNPGPPGRAREPHRSARNDSRALEEMEDLP